MIKQLKQIAPVTAWIGGSRGKQGALEAWRTAVALPREYVVGNGWQPFVLVAGPIAIYLTLRFHLPITRLPSFPMAALS